MEPPDPVQQVRSSRRRFGIGVAHENQWRSFMRSTIISIFFLTACSSVKEPLIAHSSSAPMADVEIKNHVVEHLDDYHGTKVPDPYRWLENPDSPETHRWVEAQNKTTFAYLEQIPERERIHQRLTEMWNYPRWGVPEKKGGYYFFTKNDGLQNQNVLYVTKNLNQPGRVLLDPNGLSGDGTVALTDFDITQDGKYVAYGLQTAGSDWTEWHVRNVETGSDLSDLVRWTKFSSVAWSTDGRGFYYSRYPEPKPGEKLEDTNYHNKLYFHQLGTEQSSDKLIYERPDQKEWGFHPIVTDDGHYLLISIWKGTDDKNLVYYKDLSSIDAPIRELISDFVADFSFIDNDGSTFYFRTTADAPRAKIISIALESPAKENWKVLVPEKSETLTTVDLIHKQFVAQYLKDARSQIVRFDRSGKSLGEISLPGLGTATGIAGANKDDETFFLFTSFATPPTIYRINMRSGATSKLWQPPLKHNMTDYETTQVFFKSKDQTQIPMFITYKKGTQRNGLTPTYLYGYGGFNIPITPFYSVPNMVWMEMGGILAVANLRGGGEYGEAWHDAGRLANKQNVFDDFVGAAEWLIREKYTSSQKLAIGGRSNGGLLVGAAITQRPDLFAAALPAVGVMDMLRFHKFTIGWAWVDDYGSSDTPEGFKTLYAYSPYHNIKSDVVYPPTLITTADHDDRVVPAHSFKFAARLQAAQKGHAPILIRIETSAGHGAGKPTSKQIDEWTDMWAFLVKNLGVDLSLAKLSSLH